MAGKVQMVYIDPPYGITLRLQLPALRQQARREGRPKDEDLTQAARDYQGFSRHLGAGNPLLLYPTYGIACCWRGELLTESGSCFVQISGMRISTTYVNLMDEVFGKYQTSSVPSVSIRKTASQVSQRSSTWGNGDGFYLVWYSRDRTRN